MCKVLKVSRNGYYHWIKNGMDAKEDAMLKQLIKSVFIASNKVYGTRRIKKALEKKYGWIVSRRRIGGVMQELGLVAKAQKRFKPVTTDSDHDLKAAPNLLGQSFYAYAPNQAYVGDITYIGTSQGWVYLSTVIDLYSRAMIGWAIDDSLHTPLVSKALQMAQTKRSTLQGAIFHSDRGIQYASKQFKAKLQAYGMKQSMSAKGNCYDNAVAESFFHTLKMEMVHHETFKTKKEAMEKIKLYIEFYNRNRMHSYNNYLTPMEAEMRWWQNNQKIQYVA